MNKKLLLGILIIIIIILTIILIYLSSKTKNIPTTTKKSVFPPLPVFPELQVSPFPLNTPLWFGNNDNSSIYTYPEEYYSNKPLYSGSKDISNMSIGIAFSGGGIRAACSTWGVLQALNSYQKNGKSLLNRDYISYMSSNSGSTWALLPTLYQPINGSQYTIDQILGQYKEPNNLDYSIKGVSPNFINTAVNNEFDFNLEGNWWIKSVANSFFKPYGLYDENTKGIVGFDSNSISSFLSSLGSKYRGIILRDNMPIPIAISSIANKINSGYTYIPIDSTPISSGFIVSKKISEPSEQTPLLQSIGGRVSTYAFNTKYAKIISSSTNPPNSVESFQTVNNFTNIETSGTDIVFNDTTWEPAIISGTSSFAPGPQLLPINIPNIHIPIIEKDINISLLEDFVIQTQFTTPVNTKAKIIDGYLFDDTGIVSLLVRKTQRIVVITDVVFTDIEYNSDNIIGNYVLIINGDYQNNFGKITSINQSNIVVTLIGKNTNTIFFDKQTINDNIKKIDISNIKNAFNGSIPILDNTVFGIPSNVYSQPSSVSDAYMMTMNGMIENYANTGIFYFQGLYNTIPNDYTDIIKYEVEILWYCLSPCPNFTALLSESNQKILNNMFRTPNICTLGPIYNDCNPANSRTIDGKIENFYQNCNFECLFQPLDIIINSSNIQKITDSQALAISSLTAWVTNQIVIPFINGNYGIAIQKPLPVPTFSKTIIPVPGPKPNIPEDKLLEFLKFVVRPINNVIATNFDYTTLNIMDTINKMIKTLGPDNDLSKQLQGFINTINTPFGTQGTCILGNLQVAKVLPILGNIIIDTFTIDTQNLELLYNQDTLSLNCNLNGKITLSNFKLKIYLGIGYDCNKDLSEQSSTNIDINDISATINGQTSINNINITYVNEQYVLDFSNANFDFVNISIDNYVPLIKDTILNIITQFFTQQWFLTTILTLSGFMYVIYNALDLTQTMIEFFINQCILNLMKSGLDISFIKQLGKFTCPFPCDLCKISCSDGTQKCICENGGTFIQNKGLCDCANGWYGERCTECLPNYDNSDGTCSKCKMGYTGNKCQTCPSTYDNSDGTCSKCLNNWTGDKCQTCLPNFDGTDGLCIKCLNGWDGDKCQNCPANYDNSDNTCTKCANGWYGDKCQNCPSNYDNSDNKCSKCANGYYGNKCFPKEEVFQPDTG